MSETGVPTGDYNEYMRLYMLRRHREHRARGIERLGGVCAGCGTTDLDEFDFHHVDPATKLFTISSGLKFGWDRLVVEIDKCELRCRDCHIDEHRSTAPCGTVQRYWRGCRCDPCKAAMSDYNRQRNDLKGRAERVPTAIGHGTRSGYLKEKRRGIEPCEACKSANAKVARDAYRRKTAS